jgi:guanylate kinase
LLSLCSRAWKQSYNIATQSLLQGVRQIKATNLNPIYLFIAPPSLFELKRRLRGRGTETEASVAKRLATALKEIEYAKQPGVHDIIIINDDEDRAYDLFEKAALGEEIVGDRLPPLDDVV